MADPGKEEIAGDEGAKDAAEDVEGVGFAGLAGVAGGIVVDEAWGEITEQSAQGTDASQHGCDGNGVNDVAC